MLKHKRQHSTQGICYLLGLRSGGGTLCTKTTLRGLTFTNVQNNKKSRRRHELKLAYLLFEVENDIVDDKKQRFCGFKRPVEKESLFEQKGNAFNLAQAYIQPRSQSPCTVQHCSTGDWREFYLGGVCNRPFASC